MDQSDMLKSVRRLVHEVDTTTPKYIERVGAADFSRPSYRLKLLPTSSSPLHQSASLDETSWTITAFGNSMEQASSMAEAIKAKLCSDLSVPAWLFDRRHPAPGVDINPQGTLPSGSYDIAVSGVNAIGEETLASESVRVELPSGGSIDLTIVAQNGGSTGPYVGYRVYAAVASSPLRLSGYVDISHSGCTNFNVNLIGTGSAVPGSSIFLCGLMRVNLNSIHMELLEDPDYSGKWNCHLQFSTTVQRLRLGAPTARLMQMIGSTYGGV